MHYSLIHTMQQGMFLVSRMSCNFRTRPYNYLEVNIFTFRSQELPLKKQAPEKKMALTRCLKSNSTMTLSNCNFQSEH